MELSDLKKRGLTQPKKHMVSEMFEEKNGKKKTYQNSSSLKNYKNLILQF